MMIVLLSENFIQKVFHFFLCHTSKKNKQTLGNFNTLFIDWIYNKINMEYKLPKEIECVTKLCSIKIFQYLCIFLFEFRLIFLLHFLVTKKIR